MDQISAIKNGKPMPTASEDITKDDGSTFGSYFTIIFISIIVVVACCVYFCRNCNSSSSASDNDNPDPRSGNIVARQQLELYTQNGMRDATVADSHADGYGEDATVSSARNPNHRSIRSSGGAHQLELHPDSHSQRQPGSFVDTEDMEDEEEEYEDEEGEESEEEGDERSSSPENDDELVKQDRDDNRA